MAPASKAKAKVAPKAPAEALAVPAAAAPQGSDELPLPATKRPKLNPATDLGVRPTLPPAEEHHGSRAVMKKVLPWVMQELPLAIMRITKAADTVPMQEIGRAHV